MSLSGDRIKELLAKQAQPKRKGSRGGRKKTDIDTSVRDFQTWFALAHKLYDEDTQESAKCENPNCPGTGHLVARVSGHLMCRICFLDGWLLEDPNQLGLGREKGNW